MREKLKITGIFLIFLTGSLTAPELPAWSMHGGLS